MLMGGARGHWAQQRRFEDLSDAEVVALAIYNENEAARTYRRFAEALAPDFPDGVTLFEAMAAEEVGHAARLVALFESRFGGNLPAIAATRLHDVARAEAGGTSVSRDPEEMRRRAWRMECDAARFYRQAAGQVSDPLVRDVLSELAAAEAVHEDAAAELDPAAPPTPGRLRERVAASRQFVLRVVQPGLVGLMDGSVSTLAPVFAAAFATHSSWNALLVGIAASLGAGVSMGFAEALADDGRLSGRGSPLLRGLVCGAMTVAGGIGHTVPYLIPTFWTATAIAGAVALFELLVIAWMQWRFMQTPPIAAAAKVMLGGAIVLSIGVLIGSS